MPIRLLGIRMPVSELRLPIRIVHLNIDLPPIEIQCEKHELVFCVLWKDNVPLGHVYCETLQRGPLRSDVIAALSEISVATPDRRITPLSLTKVGVAICTRDRPAELERCLMSLTSQTMRPHRVLVVDNAPASNSAYAVAKAAGVEYFREQQCGLSKARNAAIRSLDTDLVVYIDDDVELHADWLHNLTFGFTDDHIWAVTGLVLPAKLDTEAQCRFEYQWSYARGYKPKVFGPDFYEKTRKMGCPSWHIATGGNMAVRRCVFDKIGLFDERLGAGAAGCSEDSEFWYRILHAGGTVCYEPAAVVFHHHRKTLGEMAHQIRSYMSGHTAALLVQYERTGEFGNLFRLFAAMPWGYLRRAVKRLMVGRTIDSKFLLAEIAGYFEGILYYLKWKQT